MGLAAFLCGLFYGALLLDAVKREAANRRLDGMLAELREYWNKDEGCGCDECCGCGEEDEQTDSITDSNWQDSGTVKCSSGCGESEAVVPKHSMAPPVWVPITTADCDDRLSYWPKGHIEA